MASRHTNDLRSSYLTLQAVHGRMGGLTAAMRGDTRERAAKARQAFRDGWLRKVDPEGILDPEERARRAEAARRLHYVGMVAAREQKRYKRLKRAARGQQGVDRTEVPAEATEAREVPS